jgi:DNA-directed RNA polymerase subunit alpha
VEGVEHEFSSIKGVIEDMTEFILNLKQVRFKRQIEDTDTERVTVKVEGQSSFTAGDIGKYTSAFQVLNPDMVICSMDETVSLQIDLTIGKGRGYVPAEENKETGAPVGEIAIDSIFTPIRNVKYAIENYRVEQKTDYEKLLLDIETDGSIHPKDALKEAAKILIHHFMLFSDEKITLDTDEKVADEEFDEDILHMRQLLKSRLVDLDLSVRALNCLKAAEVETLGDLVQYQRSDLLKFRNFGKKSLTELDELVDKKGLTFGMNVAKYKLDKD